MAKYVAATPFLVAVATGVYLSNLRLQSGCRPEYKKRPTHTACKRPNPWCQVFNAGVPDADKAEILKLHNDYRSQVAQGRLEGYPKAADMHELLWDDELAEVAQAHANLCRREGENLRHDKWKDRFTTRFPYTGQNLAWSGHGDPVKAANWTFAVSAWFKEYEKYSPSDVAKFVETEEVMTGHFTQVIWANTQYVGCGYVHYTHEGSSIAYMTKYTCNYGPGGNVLRRPVYQKGTTCSGCPETTRCHDSTGLCDCEDCKKTGAANHTFTPILIIAVVLAAAGGVLAYWRFRSRASSGETPPAKEPAAGTTAL